ncbi:MAG: N-acetylmuramoyl-L-alanine amidase [Pseudomonadota bacterium]
MTILIVLLGITALTGINFRLIKVDSSGPVAMQMDDRQFQQYLNNPLFWASSHEGDNVSSDLDPFHVSVDDENSLVHYEDMIAGLGVPMAELFSLKVRTIVIDPGHGGIDPGATGRQGLMEKDVALDIAKKLQDKLEKTGNYRVILTREEDKKVYLKERVAFAKDIRADLFISIHINSLPEEAADLNYVETYYFGPHTDKRSLELAQKENHDSDFAMGDFREIIAKIGDTLKTEESRDLANAIHRRLYSGLRSHNNELIDAGTKTGPYMVLLGVEVPSVLVEISCISNIAEETRLSKPRYRDSVAAFLKTGIVEYLEHRGNRRSIIGGRAEYVAKQER